MPHSLVALALTAGAAAAGERNPNPAPQGHVYGAGPIKRMLQRHGRSQRGRDGTYTPHNGEREIARRLRQAERDAEHQRARLIAFVMPNPRTVRQVPSQIVGISRRGRMLV